MFEDFFWTGRRRRSTCPASLSSSSTSCAPGCVPGCAASVVGWRSYLLEVEKWWISLSNFLGEQRCMRLLPEMCLSCSPAVQARTTCSCSRRRNETDIKQNCCLSPACDTRMPGCSRCSSLGSIWSHHFPRLNVYVRSYMR